MPLHTNVEREYKITILHKGSAEQSPRMDQVLEGLDDNLYFIILTTIKITHLGFSCLTTTSQSFD